MKTVILLFTNCTKLLDAQISLVQQITLGLRDMNNLAVLTINSPVGYNTSTNRFETLKQSHQIVTIHDLVTVEEIKGNKILDSIISNADELIMLVHTTPSIEVRNCIKDQLRSNKSTSIKESSNVPASLYTQVINASIDLTFF